jgi:hypothetical protein
MIEPACTVEETVLVTIDKVGCGKSFVFKLYVPQMPFNLATTVDFSSTKPDERCF